jgi:hypothetical protein
MSAALKSLALTALVAAGMAAAAPEAAATDLAALTGDNRLIIIDIERRAVSRQVTVRGLAGRLAGIDVRAADGRLYGVVGNGDIVTINAGNGTSRRVGGLTLPLPSGRVSIDINPVADAIRIVGANDANLRHPFATGTTVADANVAFPPPPPPPAVPPPPPFGDTDPSVAAIAYTNPVPGANVPGTTATQLFDIDLSPAALYLQTPANAGTLSPLGRITNATLGGSLGFDIFVDRRGRNRGLIVTSNRLLEIDLAGGAIVDNDRIGGLAAAVRDIAVLR